MDSLDLRFLSKKANRDKRDDRRHPLFLALSKINGLKSVSGGGYTLQLLRANALFSWDKLIPKILWAVQMTVAKKRLLVQVGEPIRPTQEELQQLRTESSHGNLIEP